MSTTGLVILWWRATQRGVSPGLVARLCGRLRARHQECVPAGRSVADCCPAVGTYSSAGSGACCRTAGTWLGSESKKRR